MTPTELRGFKVALLDDIHEVSEAPVPDLDAVKARVEDFFARLEAEFGKEENSGN